MAGEVSFLTPGEEAELNEPEPNVEEPGPTPEPTVDNEEPSPPEPEPSEEPAEPKPGEEEPPASPAEEPAKAKEEEPTPQIDGILTKDGKNFIPFAVLEQERAERQRLKAEVEELRKPKPEVAARPTEEPKPAAPQVPDVDSIAKEMGVDFNALATKAYESPEGMAEFGKALFAAGMQVAGKVAQTTATATSDQATFNALYRGKMDVIESQNPWLKTEVSPGLKGEDVAVQILTSKIKGTPNFQMNSVDAWVQASNEAVAEAKKVLKLDAPAFDREAELQKMRKEVTAEVLQKFNITEAKPTTLSNVRNLSPEVLSKLDQVDTLEGVEFEIAYSKLSPAEQNELLRRKSA